MEGKERNHLIGTRLRELLPRDPPVRHLYYAYFEVISPAAEQHMFRSVLYAEDLVSDLSLHVLRAPRSTLWVIDSGSLVTPVPPTRARAPRSMLWLPG